MLACKKHKSSLYWHHNPAAAQIKQAEEYAFYSNGEGTVAVGSCAGLQAA